MAFPSAKEFEDNLQKKKILSMSKMKKNQIYHIIDWDEKTGAFGVQTVVEIVDQSGKIQYIYACQNLTQDLEGVTTKENLYVRCRGLKAMKKRDEEGEMKQYYDYDFIQYNAE